ARRHRHDTHAAEAGAVGTASAPEAGDASLPPGRGDEGLRHIRQRRERARLEGGLARLAEGVTSVSSRTDHIQIARVIGIPIYLHFSWLIIFGLIVWTLSTGYFPAQYPDLPASSYWAKGLVASLLFFLSILLHDLSHALVALRPGGRTAREGPQGPPGRVLDGRPRPRGEPGSRGPVLHGCDAAACRPFGRGSR